MFGVKVGNIIIKNGNEVNAKGFGLKLNNQKVNLNNALRISEVLHNQTKRISGSVLENYCVRTEDLGRNVFQATNDNDVPDFNSVSCKNCTLYRVSSSINGKSYGVKLNNKYVISKDLLIANLTILSDLPYEDLKTYFYEKDPPSFLKGKYVTLKQYNDRINAAIAIGLLIGVNCGANDPKKGRKYLEEDGLLSAKVYFYTPLI